MNDKNLLPLVVVLLISYLHGRLTSRTWHEFQTFYVPLNQWIYIDIFLNTYAFIKAICRKLCELGYHLQLDVQRKLRVMIIKLPKFRTNHIQFRWNWKHISRRRVISGVWLRSKSNIFCCGLYYNFKKESRVGAKRRGSNPTNYGKIWYRRQNEKYSGYASMRQK